MCAVEARRSPHLQAAEDLGAGRRALQAGVQQAVEGAGALVHGVHVVVRAIGLLLASVVLVQAEPGGAGDRKSVRSASHRADRGKTSRPEVLDSQARLRGRARPFSLRYVIQRSREVQ
jgi:hypothetical protein